MPSVNLGMERRSVVELLEDIYRALAARAFYVALMGALALPDIC